jgi:hypothetical protein
LLTSVKTVVQTMKRMPKRNLILILTMTHVTVLVRVITADNYCPMTLHHDHGNYPTQKSIVLLTILPCKMQLVRSEAAIDLTAAAP